MGDRCGDGARCEAHGFEGGRRAGHLSPVSAETAGLAAWTTLVVRTPGDSLSFAPAIRRAIREVSKSQPVGEVGTLEQVLSRSTAIPRFATVIISVLSGIALLIAVVGTYGLLAYTIAERFPELAIRLALGASSVQVSWLMLRQAMLRALTGVVSGLVGA